MQFHTFDAVIVGAGGAGLMAALYASRGAKTAVLYVIRDFGGTVGEKLLEQVKLQQEELKKSQIDLRIWGIANSRKMVLAKSGIKLGKWKESLDASAEATSVDSVIAFVKAEKPLNDRLRGVTGKIDGILQDDKGTVGMSEYGVLFQVQCIS